MSETADAKQNLASHTLTYLRRIDRRVDELTDLVTRQQELIGRLDRDMREGFSILQRDMREMKSDMVLMENRVINAVTADHFASVRLDEHEERLANLEGSAPSL